MSIEYQQFHPISGLWPEWPGRLMLTYLSGEEARITELFWTAPYQFLGCCRFQ